jgi:hypothetical protein
MIIVSDAANASDFSPLCPIQAGHNVPASVQTLPGIWDNKGNRQRPHIE